MIHSAMMFALGFFVSGLAWLALSVALVRRARRLTERRLLSSISTRRAEFETERDELRARHAVQMYRLEREVSRVLDMATAHRLEADVNEHDVVSLRAELSAREVEVQELQARLAAEQALTQELERKHAETGAALRSVQHGLLLEAGGQAGEPLPISHAAEPAPTEAGAMGVDTRAPAPASEAAPEMDGARLPRVPLPSEPKHASASGLPAGGASIVPLPTRPRLPAAETPEQSAALVAEAARDLQRLAGERLVGEARADFAKTVWRAPAHAEPRMPVAAGPGEAAVSELDAHRATPPADGTGSGPAEAGANHEARFFEALAEIRAMRRAASQAGE